MRSPGAHRLELDRLGRSAAPRRRRGRPSVQRRLAAVAVAGGVDDDLLALLWPRERGPEGEVLDRVDRRAVLADQQAEVVAVHRRPDLVRRSPRCRRSRAARAPWTIRAHHRPHPLRGLVGSRPPRSRQASTSTSPLTRAAPDSPRRLLEHREAHATPPSGPGSASRAPSSRPTSPRRGCRRRLGLVGPLLLGLLRALVVRSSPSWPTGAGRSASSSCAVKVAACAARPFPSPFGGRLRLGRRCSFFAAASAGPVGPCRRQPRRRLARARAWPPRRRPGLAARASG